MSNSAASIVARRTIETDRERTFDFLSDIDNHWLLADRFLEVIDLNGDRGGTRSENGLVRIKGPLGSARTVATRVLETEPPRRISGLAEVGRGTVAHVTWTLDPAQQGVHVCLVAQVERAGLLDRLLLAIGGRIWLRTRFEAVLAQLDHLLASG